MTSPATPRRDHPPSLIQRFSLPRLWAFVAVFLPVIAALAASLSTIDLAYQLRLGEVMLDTGELVRTDTFTFTALGAPWVDQQWGAQIILDLVYRAGGWAGLALLRAGLTGAIFLFVYLSCRAVGATMRRSAWLTLASFLVAVGGLSLRPQLFAMVLFPAAVWLVAGRRAHPGRLWIIPVLVVIWANVHGTFFLGPVLLGLAWLKDLHDGSPVARRTLVMGAVSAAATLINPFGFRVWTYAIEISSNDVISRLITEWRPPTVRDVAGAVFFGSVLVVGAILARRDRPTPWPSLLALGVFFAIGLFASRGIFWWAFAAPAILAELLSDGPQAEAKPGRAAFNVAIAAGLVVLAVLFLPWGRPLSRIGSDDTLLTEAPPGLTAAVREHLAPGERMFNAQRWGSWFELAIPQNRVFVDSRIELFPEAVWNDYSQISNGQEGWQALLDRWEIELVVASNDQQRDLIPRIRRDPGWRLLYKDADGWVFGRSAP
jgi:hypothetical protein